ncbi:kinase-like domain-containing protein [Talaromyces proteolyticus]|uniref:Kinase-like domain-containing protein n=1 Tax=Talaromyces proteolyticus TaxID=1131652 RepID=A0AAD4Q0Q0_9EURO|nr:kinase-like domain-containing protein [Talaromyces proteolyticus]KAH8697802.1 kinase-like domain-containing protein [Talaromyces proteolyticus]
MTFISKSVSLPSILRLGWRWRPLNFSNPNFVRILEYHNTKEETIPDYIASCYYLTRIGEVIKERYQVVGKLGFGSTSPAWLAWNMNGRRYAVLEIFMHAWSMGRRIEQSPKGHPGRNAIRMLLDTFYIDGPEDKHRCLVHPPLWESVLTFLCRDPVEKLPPSVIAVVLLRLFFLALDYLHTECHIIHTGFDVEEKELQCPVSRKEVDLDRRTIYMSRDLRIPTNLETPVLCDFGSAVLGNQFHVEFVQPNIYRAPEVILGVPWTYSIDIWNIGCMIWDIYEGGSLFTEVLKSSPSREMINLLGLPPPSLLAQRVLTDKFFLGEGDFCTKNLFKDLVPL